MDYGTLSAYEKHVGQIIFSEDRFETYLKDFDFRKTLPTTYQQLIHKLHYARYIPEENRREEWYESVLRFMDYIHTQCLSLGYQMKSEEFFEIYENILNLEVLPSMRLLWCAGEAVEKNQASQFNCSFIGIEDYAAFSEILFLGMSGTGVGFSVENRYVNKLPVVPVFSPSRQGKSPYQIRDSREGWADALKAHISSLFVGRELSFNFDSIRPAGKRLKTAGGFSSGPEPLKDLLSFITKSFYNAQNRRLTSLEVHDIVCKIAEAAVAGGTRRCLPVGTMIETVNGQIPIESINIGDKVISYKFSFGVKKQTEQIVIEKQNVGKKILMRIVTRNQGEILATAEHRWPVALDTSANHVIYKTTKELTKDDIILKNRCVPVSVRHVQFTGLIKTCYDIQVEETETFVANGFITHNSALISFSDLHNREMQKAKFGNWWENNSHRSLANNSAVYLERPSEAVFNDEWQNLVESKSGERGIFNQHAVLKKIKQRERRNPDLTYRSNPCFVKGTLVLTKNGMFPIEDLVGKKVDIWNGSDWEKVDNFRQTGENEETMRIKFTNGYSVDLTYTHTCILKNGKRIQAGDVIPGMQLKMAHNPVIYGGIREEAAYLKGVLFTKGDINKCTEKAYLRLSYNFISCLVKLEDEIIKIPLDKSLNKATFGKRFAKHNYGDFVLPAVGERTEELGKWCKRDSAYENLLEVLTWTYESRLHFLAGLLDSSGNAKETDEHIYYEFENLDEDIAKLYYLLLRSVGIKSDFSFNNTTGRATCWIMEEQAIELAYRVSLYKLTSFATKKCLPSKEYWDNEVSHVHHLGFAEKVYCCTVESNNSFSLANGVMFGNCSEIALQHRQFCNLSNVNVRPTDNMKNMFQKIRLATILGTIQSSITNFQYLNKEWQKTTENERLLGVSLSGLADNQHFFPSNDHGVHRMPTELMYMREHAVEVNQEWADKLGINRSTAITTIKPSGDSSQLSDTSSGIHPRYAPYYLRRIRMNVRDPIAQELANRGFPFEYAESNPNVLVFAFPQKSPKSALFENNIDPVHHAKIWLQYNKHWSEHMVSCTIMVHNDKQWEELKNFVYDNFEDVAGLSFLPYNDHIYTQAPYEEVSSDTYHVLKNDIPHIDLKNFKEYDDNTSAPNACSTAMCELPVKGKI